MKTKIFLILVILCLVYALVCVSNQEPTVIEDGKVTTEERTELDTMESHNPVAHDTVYCERIIRVPIPCDSTKGDTVAITPAEQRHYVDSAYEAWISGIEPRIDSIRVFNKTTVKEVTRERIIYKPFTPKEKSVMFGGFVSGQSSFSIDHVNIQGGVELAIKSLGIKAGYNVGENNYPFVGVEYKIR